MAYQTIAKYERGDSIPNWLQVERLAIALGVRTDDFRDADTEKPATGDADDHDQEKPATPPKPRKRRPRGEGM